MSLERAHAFGAPSAGSASADVVIRAMHARPIECLADLEADTFGSDEEVEAFLAFTASERHADLD